MRRATVCPPPRRLGAASLAILLLLGCRAPSSTARDGVGLTLPDGWTAVGRATFLVPGTALSAWRGPEGSSLVVYRTMPAPGRTAKGLMEELANRLTNLPGLVVRERRVERVGGREAARVEVTAPGFGDALAPSGAGVPIALKGEELIPTRRVCVAIPGEGGTLWLCWHCPEAALGRVLPQVEATLATARLAERAPGAS